MSEIIYLTKERMVQLERELEYLTTTGRIEIAQKIADARSHGDLSENADYDAAKEEQGMHEMKIAKIGHMLSKAQIIKADQFPSDKVYILSKVKLKNLDDGDIEQYTMVSAEEADFTTNKLSVTSLVGKALLGKTLGEKISIKVPVGILNYEIIEIGK